MRVVLLLALLVAIADARTVYGPRSQPLACPDAAETCQLSIDGVLVYSKRDPAAKWDNLRFSTVQDHKKVVLYGSINIPHREQLGLKVGKRYRFLISARKPFGVGDLWIVGAKPL